MSFLIRCFYIVYIFCLVCLFSVLFTGLAYASEGILWQASYGTCNGRLFMTPEAALKACYPDINQQGWKMIKHPSKPYYYVIGPSLDKEYQNITGYRKVCHKADILNRGESDGVPIPKEYPSLHYRRAPKGKDAGKWYPDSFKQCEGGCEMHYAVRKFHDGHSVDNEEDGTSRKAFTITRTGGLCETPPPEDPNNPQPPKPDTADDGKPDDGKPDDGKDGGSADDGSGSGTEGGSGSGSEEGEGEGEGEGDGSGKDGDSGCTEGDTGGGGCDSGSGSGDSGSADEPVDIWLRCPSGRGSYKKGTKPEGECAAKPADPKKPDDGKGDDQDKGDDDKPDPDNKQNPPNNGSDGDPSGNNPGGHGHRGGGGSSGGGGGGSHGGGSSGGSGGDGDGDGKGNGKGSISGGNCKTGKAPVCKGDEVQCYIAREQWRTSCLAESGQTDLRAKGDCKTGKKPVCRGDATTCYQLQLQFEQTCAAAGAEPDFDGAKKGFGDDLGEDEIKGAAGLGNAPSKDDIKNTFGKEVDVSSFANRFDDRGFIGVKACMAPQQYTVSGITFTIDWSYLCLFLQYVGYFVVAVGYFMGFRIVSGGFD